MVLTREGDSYKCFGAQPSPRAQPEMKKPNLVVLIASVLWQQRALKLVYYKLLGTLCKSWISQTMHLTELSALFKLVINLCNLDWPGEERLIKYIDNKSQCLNYAAYLCHQFPLLAVVA